MGNQDLTYTFKALDVFTKPLEKMSKALHDFDQKLQKTHNEAKKRLQGIKNLAGSLGKAITLPVIGAAGYAAKQVMDFEELNRQLVFVTGSAQNAEKAMAKIREISINIGTAPEDLAKADKMMISMGYSIDKANGRLKQFADMAEGTGNSVTEVTGTILRMERLGYAAKEKHHGLNARVLTSMTAKNIPLVQEMQRLWVVAGKKVEDFNKLLNQGRIGIDMAEQALTSLSARGFPPSTEQSLKRLHNLGRYFVLDLAKALYPTDDLKVSFKMLVDKAVEFEKKIVVFVKNNPQLVKMAVAIIGIAAALSPVLFSITAVISLITVLCSTVGLVVVGVMAFGVAAYFVYKNWDKISVFFKNTCKEIIGWLNEVVDFIKNIFIGVYNNTIAKITGKPIVIDVVANTKLNSVALAAQNANATLAAQKPVMVAATPQMGADMIASSIVKANSTLATKLSTWATHFAVNSQINSAALNSPRINSANGALSIPRTNAAPAAQQTNTKITVAIADKNNNVESVTSDNKNVNLESARGSYMALSRART